MKVYKNLFQQIVSSENLFAAWDKFRVDKRHKKDVKAFEFKLEQNIFQLHRDLATKQYRHQPYTGFYIRDPKIRHIHKASARDRILHHAVFQVLNPIFDKTFIPTSFSCRVGKGVHRGVLEMERMIRAESRNFTRPCFALKCDVQKFFDSVDHQIMLSMLRKKVSDEDTLWLLREIIKSFATNQTNLFDRQGLPIGNLTSQLFANIYMNEFDQFAKHELRLQRYARYTDDFVIISTNRQYLEEIIDPVRTFLESKLKLRLHPKSLFRIFFPTPFCAILAAKPSDFLCVGTATPRQSSGFSLEISSKWLWKKDSKQALRKSLCAHVIRVSIFWVMSLCHIID